MALSFSCSSLSSSILCHSFCSLLQWLVFTPFCCLSFSSSSSSSSSCCYCCSASGFVVSTVAGSSSGLVGCLDADGRSARFHSPCGLTVDSQGSIFVCDTENHRIAKITFDATGWFFRPCFVCDAKKILYCLFLLSFCVILCLCACFVGVAHVSSFAGQDRVKGYADGEGNNAMFTYPTCIACDAEDNLIVTEGWDGRDYRVRLITPEGILSSS